MMQKRTENDIFYLEKCARRGKAREVKEWAERLSR